MQRYKHRKLLNAQQVSRSLDTLAEDLAPLLGDDQVTVIPIMGGAMIFAADLVRRLPAGLVMDFIRIQTYGDSTSPQNGPQADWVPRLENVEGKHILLLDDILDTGRTMNYARNFLLEEMKAAKVTIAVLIDKPARRAVKIKPDAAAIDLQEDLFLVGVGLDFQGLYRNMPDLLALETDSAGMPIET
ncbi:MAG: phosphoribosyltransferase family protein, partial [Planctomycetota bacterium]|nr:phosphoribosyltransferase family protein [Planctomycetota bacterium]